MKAEQLTALADRAHECKRGLATATPDDYNQWWRALRQYAKEKPYVRHEPGCAHRAWDNRAELYPPCTCGLDEVRSDDT